MLLVFNFRKFLLYDVKLLTMGHGTKFKSTGPAQGTIPWTSLSFGHLVQGWHIWPER